MSRTFRAIDFSFILLEYYKNWKFQKKNFQ